MGRGCAMQCDKRRSSLWEDIVDDPSGADGASTEPAGEPVGKNIFISLGCSDGHGEVCSQQASAALMYMKGSGNGNVCVNIEVVDGDSAG